MPRSYGLFFDHDDVLKLLHSRIKAAGGQRAFSRQSGLDRTQLSMVLNGRRPVSPSIIKALNLRIVYAPVGRQSSAMARAAEDD
jgi:hypothetical protein